jgi:regulator of sirC expression with transglutaminase-like and TPR domain
MSPIEARARALARYARGADADALVRGALVIASIEHGDLDPTPTLETLGAMGHEAGRRLARITALEERVRTLGDYLFEDLGFHGNEDRYDDPRNSFLNDVLVRRTGIPISLATVYLDVGRRAGLSLEGVNFPGHFLVRALGTGAHDPDLLIDVFHRGAILREIDCQRLLERHAGGEVILTAEALAAADVRQTLARMATNLKRLYVRSRSFAQALDATHLLVALDDDAPVELRDRGLLAYQLKRFPDALHDLERYLRLISPPFVTGAPAVASPAGASAADPSAADPLSDDEDDEDRKEYEQIWEHVKTLRRRVAGYN